MPAVALPMCVHVWVHVCLCGLVCSTSPRASACACVSMRLCPCLNLRVSGSLAVSVCLCVYMSARGGTAYVGASMCVNISVSNSAYRPPNCIYSSTQQRNAKRSRSP